MCLLFFWYGFGQSLTRTLTTPPIGEWMSAAWHAIWKIEGDEVVTIGLPEAAEPPTAPLLTDAEKEALQEEIERELPEEFTEAEQVKESKYVTVQPTQPPAKVEEYTIDYLEYDLIWYVNDVNREHTEVLMTRREDRAFTRSYTYGNERLTWDYGAWKGGSKNLWNYYAWKYLPTTPSTHGQYVNDGRGSAAMLLDTTSNNTQLSHYYEPYGETLTSGSLAPSTRRAQAAMWDAYGFNAEDYDAGTGMSYLRARYLDIAMGGFITEDTYKGNIFNPASLNLRGYVEGNPVKWVDPSGMNKCDYAGYLEEMAKYQAKHGYAGRMTLATKISIPGMPKQKGVAFIWGNSMSVANNISAPYGDTSKALYPYNNLTYVFTPEGKVILVSATGITVQNKNNKRSTSVGSVGSDVPTSGITFSHNQNGITNTIELGYDSSDFTFYVTQSIIKPYPEPAGEYDSVTTSYTTKVNAGVAITVAVLVPSAVAALISSGLLYPQSPVRAPAY
jgi:RHS repeat-associated protein